MILLQKIMLLIIYCGLGFLLSMAVLINFDESFNEHVSQEGGTIEGKIILGVFITVLIVLVPYTILYCADFFKKKEQKQ